MLKSSFLLALAGLYPSFVQSTITGETITFSDVSCNSFTGASSLKPMPAGYGGFSWTNVNCASIMNSHSAVVANNVLGTIRLSSPGHPIKNFNISSFNAGCLGGNPPKPVDCLITISGNNAAGKTVASKTFNYRAAGGAGTSGSPGTKFTFDKSFSGLTVMQAEPHGSGQLWGYCANIAASVLT